MDFGATFGVHLIIVTTSLPTHCSKNCSIFSGNGTPQDRALDSLIDIYVLCRVIVIAGGFFLQPVAPRLRLLRMSDAWAVFVQRWIVRRYLPVTDWDSGVRNSVTTGVGYIGVCAADNEPAKYHFDGLMRRWRRPWTLGEVLSGGIGGFVHWFVPEGPCYGCVASHLKRSVAVDKPKTPDYSQPEGALPETVLPASKASIEVIASLHALITLQLLASRDPSAESFDPGFTSMLLPLQRVPDVFAEPFRPFRFRIARSPDCLICRPAAENVAAEDLDAAVDQALRRLGHG